MCNKNRRFNILGWTDSFRSGRKKKNNKEDKQVAYSEQTTGS